MLALNLTSMINTLCVLTAILMAGCSGGGASGNVPASSPPAAPLASSPPAAPLASPPPAAPVVISASHPATVSFGQTAVFQVSASNADNLPITYSIQYGPAGMVVDSYGQVSWSPKEPMLRETLNVNFSIRAQTQSSFADYLGSIQVNDPNRLLPLVRSGVRGDIHALVDIDADGISELITAAKETINIHKFDGAGFNEDWVYPYSLGAKISSIAVHDLNGDGSQDLVIASGQTVNVIDGNTKKATAIFQANGSSFYELNIADINNDGTFELVCLTLDSLGQNLVLNVYNLGTLTKTWSAPAQTVNFYTPHPLKEYSIALGNVDNDPALEIVTSGGQVFDGATLSLEWNFNNPFGLYIDTGDLNNDGIEEIVGNVSTVWSQPDAIRIYDAVNKIQANEILSPLHNNQTEFAPGILIDNFVYSKFQNVHIAQADNDPYAEIIIGEHFNGYSRINVYDGISLAQQGVVYDPNFRKMNPSLTFFGSTPPLLQVSSIAVGDIQQDGIVEIIWSNQYSYSNQDSRIEMSSVQPVMNLAWNSNPATLYPGGRLGTGGYARSGPGSGKAIFPILDNIDDTRYVTVEPSNGLVSYGSFASSSRIYSTSVYDYDSDGVDEVFHSRMNQVGGFEIVAMDPFRNVEEVIHPTTTAIGDLQIELVDVSGDGVPEILGLTRSSNEIIAVDMQTGSIIWSVVISPPNASWLTMRGFTVADINFDNIPEIICRYLNGIVVLRFNGTTYSQAGTLETPTGTWFESYSVVEDIDSDNEIEIVLIDQGVDVNGFSKATTSRVMVYHVDTFTLEKSYEVPYNVWASVTDPTNPGNILLTAQDAQFGNHLILIQGESGKEIWKQSNFIGNSHNSSGVDYVDTNNDGLSELIFSNSSVMYVTR